MYKPMFNHVLVEVDEKDKQWGSSDDSLGGAAYREGKLLSICNSVVPYGDTGHLNGNDIEVIAKELLSLVGKRIMWNEGHEAGKTFEEDGKLYALIYWWDLVACEDSK